MYSAEKKKNAVTQYVIHGNVRKVSEMTNIPVETLYDWQRESWWHDLEAQVRSGVKAELMGKMQGIVTRALDVLEDRLVNGDVVLNLKTGETIRRPVAARDVQRIATEVLGKKISLEKEVDRSQVRKETVQEMLGVLAKGFLEFNKKQKPVEIVDAEVVEVTHAISQ